MIALGWVSLLTDAASDMIYPLVPALLLTIGGGAVALGWVEGVAEAVAALVKLVAGRASDRAASKKGLIAIGYGISSFSRPLFAIVAQPWQAVVVRAIDRVGKGMRGPPRDALIAGAVAAEQRGFAFGFHRMMDNFGGVLGPVIAFALLRVVELPLRQVFVAALVPGILAVLTVILFVREPAKLVPAAELPPPALPPDIRDATPKPPVAEPPPAVLPSAAKRYFLAILLFSLAGSGDLFLMKRITDLGMDVALVPIVWVSLQLGKGLLNVPGGHASDRYGRRRVLAIAWLLYSVSYVALGMVRSWQAAWLVLVIYAVYYGLAEGGQRALLAEYVPARARGRAYGIQLAIEGIMVLPANVIFGWVYERYGASTAFYAGGFLALASVLALAWVPSPPKLESRA